MNINTMWMVRAGNDGFLFDVFQNKNIVAIGHNYLGDLTNINNDKEEIRKIFRDRKKCRKQKPNEPELNEKQIGIRINKIISFIFKISIGNFVITYNPKNREYLVGNINSVHKTNHELCIYQNIRGVKWAEGMVKRDDLSSFTKKHLARPLAVFRVDKQVADEIIKLMKV